MPKLGEFAPSFSTRRRELPAESLTELRQANWVYMKNFRPVACTACVTVPRSTLVEADDRLVVLIPAAGHWYALDDVCTNRGEGFRRRRVSLVGRC